MATGDERNTYGVLHLFGRDDKGLVWRAARVLEKVNANIDDGLAHESGGWATVMLYFACANGRVDQVRALTATEFKGMKHVSVVDALPPAQIPEEKRGAFQPFLWRVHIESTDDVGLLAAATDVFRRTHCNLEAFHCEKYTAPRAWEALCTQIFTVRPAKREEVTRDFLRAEIQKELGTKTETKRPVTVSLLSVEPV